MLLERRPATPLSLYVEKLWHCEQYRTPHRYERVLPTGAFHLIFDLTGAAPALAVGIQTRASILDTTAVASTMGVVFRPACAGRFLAAPPDRFADAVVPLDSVWGRTDLPARLRELRTPAARFDLLEAVLLARLAGGDPHPAVQQALAHLRRAPSIGSIRSLTRDAGIGPRRFGQLFREQVGLAPKVYARILRFQAVVRQAARGGPIEWAAVAADGGFADQAHLSHEFRAFSGMPPAAWLAAERPFANHVAID